VVVHIPAAYLGPAGLAKSPLVVALVVKETQRSHKAVHYTTATRLELFSLVEARFAADFEAMMTALEAYHQTEAHIQISSLELAYPPSHASRLVAGSYFDQPFS